MIPFVAGVLTGMAAQKILGDNGQDAVFEPVEMREVTEEQVKETLSKANKVLQENGTALEMIPAQEVSDDELPDYIRKKLADIDK